MLRSFLIRDAEGVPLRQVTVPVDEIEQQLAHGESYEPMPAGNIVRNRVNPDALPRFVIEEPASDA